MQLTDIKGFGEKRVKMLADAGIFTPLDLIMCFPCKYIDLSREVDFTAIKDNEQVSLLAKIDSLPVTQFVRKGLSFVKVKCACGDKFFTCTWFNQKYVANKLQVGKMFYFSGRVKKFKSSIDISAPILSDYKEGDAGIISIYPKIKGLPANLLTEAIAVALNSITVNSYLTNELTTKYKLMPLNQAFRVLHQPKFMEQIELAQRTVAIENLSYTLCIFMQIKQKNAENRVFSYLHKESEINLVMKSLPFILTHEQQKVFSEILQALHSKTQMNRLLQGDVGCGKTIIAFLSIYYAYLSGFQGVIMAPTELLARQHYENAIKIFGNSNVKIELLTGSQTKKERDNSLFLIKNGMADIIIGTHSLIQDSVEFARLSLVVTDEQHRFGVNQRARLENKASGCDCLVMSATPIPRTLALTLYGDLQQSQIMQMPTGRAKITTKIVPERKLEDMLLYIYNKAKSGEQSFIVCPRIENEDDDLISVAEQFAQISKKFPDLNVGALHGQLKDIEKQEIMSAFASGKLQVLVTTTVIEVGIDIPNATTMVIYNAERYGLSQLHQLRGRVGRGKIDSFCFLHSNNENQSTIDRLNYFCNCNSGFELAEYDFEARGAGDFIGTKQHGDSSQNMKINTAMILSAKDLAQELMNQPEICSKLTSSIGESGCEYIKSVTLN